MIRNYLIISLSSLALMSCTLTEGGGGTLPQLTYEHLSKIPVNVSRIEMTNETQRGSQAWDIANQLPTPPDVAMRKYLNQRFKASGQDGVLTVTLVKADVQVNSAPNENKILSYLPLANNQDYTFEIVIDLLDSYHSGQPDSKTSTRFVRKVRMPVKVTMAYREAMLQKTLEEMVRDIDEAMISTLSNKFNLIATKDIPVKVIETNTIIPANETKIDVFFDKVGDTIITATDSIFDFNKDPDDVVRPTLEKTETIKPVKITPLID